MKAVVLPDKLPLFGLVYSIRNRSESWFTESHREKKGVVFTVATTSPTQGLCPLATDSTSELHVLCKDRDPFGMQCGQVDILE
jgi:hypothetical protein